MARKLALIIGNSQYQDACLARLAAPDVDVRALAEVLSTPGIGAFDDVTQLLNEGLATVRKAIAQFFDLKHRDDLLFLYFSGHGVRDEQGHLHLAVRDTERKVLAGTAIEASFITGRMDRSASKRLVLVLDCCHSGAFGYGTKAAQGATVGTATAFEGTGRGRVVLTATDSTQYAWDGDQVLGQSENSLFTHYMIEGLRTGAADRDGDGLITIDELYDYVYDHVLNETPSQTPGKWAYGQQGEIIIAQNAAASRGTLPPEIQEAVSSTLPSVRLEAVRQLDSFLRGRHAPRASAARDALKRLAEDDSRRVAAAANDTLHAFERGDSPVKPELLAHGIQIEKQNELERARAAEEARRIEEERARLEDAERRIRELRQRIGTLIARANAATAHDEAIALLNKALGLDPEHGEVKELLEDRHRLRQKEEAAERRARSLATVKERIVRHLERGELEEAEGALASADALAAPAEDLVPLRERLAQSHADRRREAEAAQAAAEAEARKRREIERHLSEAERYLTRGKLTNAIVVTDLALGLDPEHTDARALQADIQRAIEAQKDVEQRVARLMAAAQTAVDEQRFPEATDALEQVRAIAPDTAGLQQLFDLVQAGLDAQRAGELAREEAERERRALDKMLARAEKRYRRRDYSTALALVEDILTRDGQHVEALSLRAQVVGAIADPPVHPPGFSPRDTLSVTSAWLRTKGLHSNAFWISAGLILAVAAAIGIWRGLPEQQQQPPPLAATPISTSSSPTPIQEPPKAEAAEPAKPVPEPSAPPNRSEVVVSSESAARRHLEAGNLVEALKSLRLGLTVDATDAGLQELLLKIEAEAQLRASNAEKGPEKAGTLAMESKAFANAKRNQKDAERLRDQGRHEIAIRHYLDAARLFGEASATKPAPPSPEATTPVSPAVAAASAAIERVRQRYEAGFKNRSLDEIKAVWPDMSRIAGRTLSDFFNNPRSVAPSIQCQPPVFTDLERGQTSRRPTAVLHCYERWQELSPAGGVRVETSHPATLHLRADRDKQVWVITAVTSQLFR